MLEKLSFLALSSPSLTFFEAKVVINIIYQWVNKQEWLEIDDKPTTSSSHSFLIKHESGRDYYPPDWSLDGTGENENHTTKFYQKNFIEFWTKRMT